MRDELAKTPYLHVRRAPDDLFEEAVEITGNHRALLRLRRQIDRALRGENSYPLNEGVYREMGGEKFKGVVRRAKSREEMEERTRAVRAGGGTGGTSVLGRSGAEDDRGEVAQAPARGVCRRDR